VLSDSTARVYELERDTLRVLCLAGPRDAAFEAARQALRGYPWQGQEHRVVFEAIERVRIADPAPMREQLAAHATRMGFPDVDWRVYFVSVQNPKSFKPTDLEQSIRQLKALVQP
jgi:hypothetical protein